MSFPWSICVVNVAILNFPAPMHCPDKEKWLFIVQLSSERHPLLHIEVTKIAVELLNRPIRQWEVSAQWASPVRISLQGFCLKTLETILFTQGEQKQTALLQDRAQRSRGIELSTGELQQISSRSSSWRIEVTYSPSC